MYLKSKIRPNIISYNLLLDCAINCSLGKSNETAEKKRISPKTNFNFSKNLFPVDSSAHQAFYDSSILNKEEHERFMNEHEWDIESLNNKRISVPISSTSPNYSTNEIDGLDDEQTINSRKSVDYTNQELLSLSVLTREINNLDEKIEAYLRVYEDTTNQRLNFIGGIEGILSSMLKHNVSPIPNTFSMILQVNTSNKDY
jgi:hypothetical protein